MIVRETSSCFTVPSDIQKLVLARSRELSDAPREFDERLTQPYFFLSTDFLDS